MYNNNISFALANIFHLRGKYISPEGHISSRGIGAYFTCEVSITHYAIRDTRYAIRDTRYEIRDTES